MARLLLAPFVAGLVSDAMAQGEAEYEDNRVYWSRRDFVIPFNVDSNGQAPREIRLEYSEDNGRNWALYSSGDVRTKQFHFKTSVDGEYLFRLKTLDQQGRAFDNPGEPLRVLVDTTRPEAKLIIDIDQRGTMQAEFAISDIAMDEATIQLQYQTEAIPQWQDIQFQLEPGDTPEQFYGRGSWSIPNNTRQLVVHLTGKDKAGNPFEVTRLPQLPRSASAATNMQFASGRTRDAKGPMVTNTGAAIGSGLANTEPPSLPKVEVLSGPGAKANNKMDSALAAQLFSEQQFVIEQQRQLIEQHKAINRQFADEQRLRQDSNNVSESANSTIDLPPRAPEGEFSIPSHYKPKSFGNDNRTSKLPVRVMSEEEIEQFKQPNAMSLAANRSGKSLVVNDPNAPTPPPSGLTSLPNPSTPSPTTPSPTDVIPGQTSFRNNIRPLYSNTRSFSLDYNIDNESNSQVSNVELWGTIDEGQTWQIWGQDPDRASPFDIQVEGDGLFGFRMVIVGTNGLASNRPRNGDNADAWIHVDTQIPQVKLTSALYGKGAEAGTLVLEYQARDEFFTDRPITLAYSETPNGPWTTIANGIRNNGRYVWPADPSLPPIIFLRIEAFDAAGNVGVHRLELPVEVQGLAPRGRIQGFRPLK